MARAYSLTLDLPAVSELAMLMTIPAGSYFMSVMSAITRANRLVLSFFSKQIQIKIDGSYSNVICT